MLTVNFAELEAKLMAKLEISSKLISLISEFEAINGRKPGSIYMLESVWRALTQEWLDYGVLNRGGVLGKEFIGIPVYVVSDGRHPAVKII